MRSVEKLDPGTGSLHGREREASGAGPAVEEQQDGGAAGCAPALVDVICRLAADEHAEDMIRGVAPLLRRHLLARGPEPGQILLLAGSYRLVSEETATP